MRTGRRLATSRTSNATGDDILEYMHMLSPSEREALTKDIAFRKQRIEKGNNVAIQASRTEAALPRIEVYSTSHAQSFRPTSPPHQATPLQRALSEAGLIHATEVSPMKKLASALVSYRVVPMDALGSLELQPGDDHSATPKSPGPPARMKFRVG